MIHLANTAVETSIVIRAELWMLDAHFGEISAACFLIHFFLFLAEPRSHLTVSIKNHKVTVNVNFSHMNLQMVSLFFGFCVYENGLNIGLRIIEFWISKCH